MKKLFLWTFVLALLCTWAVVVADEAPNALTTSSQGSDLDREAIKAQKDKAAQEMISRRPLITNVAPAGSAVPKLEKEVIAEPQRISGPDAIQVIDVEVPYQEPQRISGPEATSSILNATPVSVPEKAPYTGPANVPDQNVILQGGDVCATATVIPAIPYTNTGTTSGYVDDYDEACTYTGSTSPDVVYSYTPEVDMAINISLCSVNTLYDTKVYVYENVCQERDDGQDPYACNDDALADCTIDAYQSVILCMPVTAQNTYYIVVDGFGGDLGPYEITVTECAVTEETCADASVWDNNVADGTNGARPTVNWDPNGMIDDVQLESQTDFTCIRVEVAEGTTPPGVPSDIQSTRIRIYDAPNGMGSLDWPTDGPNPVFDYTYQKSDFSMMEIDSGGDLFGRDHVYFDLCGPNISLPAGNYGVFLTFPGRGPDDFFWLSATNAHANETNYIWGPDVNPPSPNSFFPETAFHLGIGTCEDVYGACCDDATGVCEDDVLAGDCPAPLRFAANTLCENLEPPCGWQPTGACCIDEVCEFTSEEQPCLDVGGEWFEGETCPDFECPSDPCVNAIWQNGEMDYVNSLAADRRADGTLDAWVVDDVVFQGPAHVTDLHWWCVTDEAYVFENTDDWIVLADAGGQPGAVIVEEWDVPNTRFWTGEYGPWAGRPLYIYTLYVDLVLPPGTYWFGMRPVNQGGGQNFWMTAPVIGSEIWFQSNSFGYPNFVIGNTVFGASHDVTFCVTGDTQIEPGACCDDATGDCIDDVPVEQCPAPLRFASGVLCIDLEPPCGEVTGACCDAATGDCVEMTGPECAARDWDYQGDWTTCDPNPCPNPFCHDYEVNAPVENATGSTCGMGDDCALQPTEEVIYKVEIPNDGEWVFSLCGSTYDTYLFVGTTCCGMEIGENDDFCGLQSQLSAVITAGTYYVDIEGYSGCGDYVLNVYQVEECVVECPPGGLDEAEPCDQDTNGGCNTDPANPPTTPISCGDTYCGLGWFDGSTRDTDWYYFEIPGGGLVTVTLEAEFDALFGIIVPFSDDICDNDGTVTHYALPDACTPGLVQANLTGDTPYVIFVAPLFNDLVTCGDYWVSVDCGECPDFMTVDIFTDEYPDETSWEMIERASGTVVGSAGPLVDPFTQHHWEVCGDPNLCYDFYIYDLYGDGICCEYGDGHYEIYDFAGTMVCSGGDFGSVEVCPDIGQCVPPTGACCIDDICEYTSEEQPCLDDGGTWYVGEDCDAGFECPTIGCLTQMPNLANGIFSDIHCDICGGLQVLAENTDFGAPVNITALTFWGGYYPTNTVLDPDHFTVIFRADDGGGLPGAMIASMNDVAADIKFATGRILFGVDEHEYTINVDPPQPVPELVWIEIYNNTDPSTDDWFWETGDLDPAYGIIGQAWTTTIPEAPWNYDGATDMALIVECEPQGGDDCQYVPGDPNCNTIPAELPDVIAMIGMYRGTVPHCYECDCPPHGNFAPSADPNGNCISDELPDVVAMIGIYRGTVPIESCDDCPGQGLLAPGGIVPSLKSKAKAIQQSVD